MKLSEAFPSNFLKADDLNGKPVTLTISNVEMESLGQGKDKESKLIVQFKGTEKKLVCNKTNANTIGKLYGDDTDAWLGQRITIKPMEVEFQGEMKLAIRVSLTKPAPAAAAPVKAAVVAEDEPPFPTDEECPV
jgi:hypothetical protein